VEILVKFILSFIIIYSVGDFLLLILSSKNEFSKDDECVKFFQKLIRISLYLILSVSTAEGLLNLKDSMDNSSSNNQSGNSQNQENSGDRGSNGDPNGNPNNPNGGPNADPNNIKKDIDTCKSIVEKCETRKHDETLDRGSNVFKNSGKDHDFTEEEKQYILQAKNEALEGEDSVMSDNDSGLGASDDEDNGVYDDNDSDDSGSEDDSDDSGSENDQNSENPKPYIRKSDEPTRIEKKNYNKSGRTAAAGDLLDMYSSHDPIGYSSVKNSNVELKDIKKDVTTKLDRDIEKNNNNNR
jgi:hypothetical protein